MRPPNDLSSPRGTRSGAFYDADAFGRVSELVARFLGTARYLVFQTVLVVIWISFNVAFVKLRFDQYPFILLNLAFSTQAAYAAPLILLAQNRQAERDKSEIERDREVNARALAEADFLAREVAAIRFSLEGKVDREDLADAVMRLTEVIERLATTDPGARRDVSARE